MRNMKLARAAAVTVASTALILGGVSAASAAPAPGAIASSGVHPHAAGATLTSASISFFTLDDNKDFDTLLTIQVRTAGGTVVASKTGFFGEFRDQSTTTIPLPIRSGISWEALQGGSVRLTIQPNGNDTWKFGYELDLNFSDGDFVPTTESRLSLSEDNKVFTDRLQF